MPKVCTSCALASIPHRHVGQNVVWMDKPKAPKARSGAEFWRKHHSLALAIGENQVAEMEEHYRKHGIHVSHRRTACGDYEPVVTRREQFDAMLKARGMVDKG